MGGCMSESTISPVAEAKDEGYCYPLSIKSAFFTKGNICLPL